MHHICNKKLHDMFNYEWSVIFRTIFTKEISTYAHTFFALWLNANLFMSCAMTYFMNIMKTTGDFDLFTTIRPIIFHAAICNHAKNRLLLDYILVLLLVWVYNWTHTLFRNKRFMLDEMFQQNASKFDIFLE